MQHPFYPILQLSDERYFWFAQQTRYVQTMFFETIEKGRIHLRKLFLFDVDQTVEGRVHEALGVVVGSHAHSTEVAVADPMEGLVE